MLQKPINSINLSSIPSTSVIAQKREKEKKMESIFSRCGLMASFAGSVSKSIRREKKPPTIRQSEGEKNGIRVENRSLSFARRRRRAAAAVRIQCGLWIQ